MRSAVLRLILLRILPARLMPVLTLVEIVRIARWVRRMRRGSR